jgi:hypothetical protein
VAEGWRRLHNEELQNLYAPPVIIRVMKSRWMRLAGQVVRTGETKNAYKFLVENLKGRDHLEDLGEDRLLGNRTGVCGLD